MDQGDRMSEPFLELRGIGKVYPGVTALSDVSIAVWPAEVVGLDESCQGFSRRRLMDLGFTPGTRIETALRTFAGDPRGYRIRGTLVALRADQARHVLVRPDSRETRLEQAR